MVDREKVIKGLYAHGYKDCKSCPYWGSGLHGASECKELAREALSLLREQEPVKWVKISPAGIYECSGCGQNVMTSDITAYKYCHGCGRKVKWDG